MTNISSGRVNCLFKDKTSADISYWMDLAVRILVPFIFMSIFTVLLLVEVFRLRTRIIRNFLNVPTTVDLLFSVAENNKFQKDIQLAVNSIVLNLSYITISLPATVSNFYANFLLTYYFNFYILCIYILFVSYAINFYLLCITNSLIRRELSKFMHKMSTVFETYY